MIFVLLLVNFYCTIKNDLKSSWFVDICFGKILLFPKIINSTAEKLRCPFKHLGKTYLRKGINNSICTEETTSFVLVQTPSI